ncbi:MAG: hypothetical protein EA379_05865 [Phycisphaerales bacterium]|nr:MAG: hypothetical protein EA379_05865 [Phycisphaerales bacterium]
MRTRVSRIAPLLLLILGPIVGVSLSACEHNRHWRGGRPWPTSFINRVSDPIEMRLELASRMHPAAPAVGAQTMEQANLKSLGCMSCHGPTDEPDMHPGMRLAIGCTDCHGGDATIFSPMPEPGRPGAPGTPIEDREYLLAMQRAHIQPRNPEAWYGLEHLTDGRAIGAAHGHADPLTLHGSRNPENTYALLNQETPEFIRFVNPGDLRVADYSCGACHAQEVAVVRRSMMSHGAMLWGAALYNNGAYPIKINRFGESYSPFGQPQRVEGVLDISDGLITLRNATDEEIERGVLTHLDPLPPWNIAQPGNMLRIFERGTKLPVPGGPLPNPDPADIGNPNPLVEGGRPDKGLSPRGLGTLNRTDPVFLGLQKTRLLDPTLNFLGTNDHPGDFRSAGCTACHTPYANDRALAHSGPYSQYGHEGFSRSIDPTIPHDRPGHPIRHVLTNAVPNSQCITCHIHPGTSYANTYLGYMWWDLESDGEHFYPAEGRTPTSEQAWRSFMKNPEAASKRGLWGDLYPDAVSHAGDVAGENFLARTGEPPRADGQPVFNDRLEHNKVGDFHGHGWIFRRVHKQDRRGNLLTLDDEVIDPTDPDRWRKAVHLQDVHLQRGMHCIDCHFTQDVHGDGRLYGEPRNAIEIACIDCHGSYDARATLRTSGPAAPPGGTDLTRARIGPQKQRRFEWRGDTLIQRSAMDPDLEWEVVQTIDTINPGSAWAGKHPEVAEASRYAKTIRRDGRTWGDLPGSDDGHGLLAHSMEDMECYTCHTSWMTSCFGCHLPMRANRRTPMLHNENLFTRNYTEYNFQVLRDDVFMLGRDGSVKGGKIVPVRSSSGVLVSSQNQNREWVYSQQQTVSSEGYAGQAFNPHFPHATGARGTTKRCTDCHVSSANDNNAWMAQVTLQGTNFVNFMGRYAYVATGSHGLEAVVVTEREEPQAVIGSNLHRLAFPQDYARFVEQDGRILKESYHHDAGWGGEILDVQLRGEYLYAARGRNGFYVYDVANIDHKGFSERIVTAPVSPLGQRLGFRTSYAVAVASPSTLALDPARVRISNDPSKPVAYITDERQLWHINQEQAMHPLYAFLYIGDRDEGLIITNAATLLDGDPDNNFLSRATLADGADAFNPEGLLTGLTHLTLAGHYVYATSAHGLVVIDIDTPLNPRVVGVVGSDALREPTSVAVQFRYAFVTDADGLKVIDVTDPTRPFHVEGATAPIEDARRVYVSRTHALVAAGARGVAFVDVENPESPGEPWYYDADGAIDDAHDVKVAMTNASLFAYVADGRNGLRVLRLMGPDSTERFRGFSPPLEPLLIATAPTGGPALAVSKPLDRDRAVDETGNQVAVFGRLGARPLNREEMRRLFLRDGEVWTVSDTPETEPQPFTFAPAAAEEEQEDEGAPRRRRR